MEISYGDAKIGEHALDFIIDNKIVLEIKTIPSEDFSSTHQVLSYLKSSGKKLGIVANFRTLRLTYRRAINPKKIDY